MLGQENGLPTIDFFDPFVAKDYKIREAVARAEAVFASVGKTADEAWCENIQSVAQYGENSRLWTAAE